MTIKFNIAQNACWQDFVPPFEWEDLQYMPNVLNRQTVTTLYSSQSLSLDLCHLFLSSYQHPMPPEMLIQIDSMRGFNNDLPMPLRISEKAWQINWSVKLIECLLFKTAKNSAFFWRKPSWLSCTLTTFKTCPFEVKTHAWKLDSPLMGYLPLIHLWCVLFFSLFL